MEDRLQFEHIRGTKWLDLNGCVSLDPGIQQGPPMSRQTDHILYKFQGCSTRGRRPATASRSLRRTGQRPADAGGPQSIVGRRWQRNRRCDGLIKPQVTTISGRPRPVSDRNDGGCDVGDRACLRRGRKGPASLTSHKSDRSAERCRERT